MLQAGELHRMYDVHFFGWGFQPTFRPYRHRSAGRSKEDSLYRSSLYKLGKRVCQPAGLNTRTQSSHEDTLREWEGLHAFSAWEDSRRYLRPLVAMPWIKTF